jgi:putative oxidoreductase
MKITALVGRILFSLMFLQSVGFHFSDAAVNYAINAGVPLANVLVPVSGLLALVGGLCILLGYKAKFGAWLIVLFLIPVTIFMHAFWKETDPVQSQVQYTMFFKNLAMLGGAFLITYFGSGPLSLENTDHKNDYNKIIKRLEIKQREEEHARLPLS